MRLLRLLFNLPQVYFKQTLHEILIWYGIALLIGVAVYFSIQDRLLVSTKPLVWIFLVLILYGMVRAIVRNRMVARILQAYPPTSGDGKLEGLSNAAGSLELDGADFSKLIAKSDGLKVYSLTFDLYKKTKHGEYLAKQSYYTLLEIRLSRQLPHILFDSKTAKSSQFKKLYQKSQRISVQGGFDVIFDTYVPPFYTIDTLSFITPEVMEALVAARDYDIEILDDKLLLYAPLLALSEIERLKTRGLAVAKELNDNIDTYHDNRLSGTDRTTKVTPFARTLLRNPMPLVLSAIGTGVLLLVTLYFAFMTSAGDKLGLLQPIIFFAIGFVGCAIQARNVIKSNQRAIEGYRILHMTDRGKPLDPSQP